MSKPESNVLTRIVDTKVAHIAALKLRFPEARLQPKMYLMLKPSPIFMSITLLASLC